VSKGQEVSCNDREMIEMEVAEMKSCKPASIIRRSHLLPPHIPREMPAIYQVLEGIEERVKLLKKGFYRRLGKGNTEIKL